MIEIEAHRIFNSFDNNFKSLEAMLIKSGRLKLQPTGVTKQKGTQTYVEVRTPSGTKLFINSKNIK
jgi:hypothetical protein